jgi:uncharacterized protein (TIGR03083 family)
VTERAVVRIRPGKSVILNGMAHFTDLEAGESDVIDEVGEFLTTLLATPPTRLTNCRGWTAHELTAHLAAGAAEEADLIEAHLAGATPRATRAHDERESPYRALPDPELRDQLVAHGGRLTTAMHQLAAGDAPTVDFTGRPMSAADFAMHSRSECAVHRWDLVGRDDIGWRMLAQPSLTKHALTVLTSMSTLAEAPANRVPAGAETPVTRLVLRSEPHDDVIVALEAGVVSMECAPIDASKPDVELGPSARLLLLWGRREPSAPIDVHATGAARDCFERLFGS